MREKLTQEERLKYEREDGFKEVLVGDTLEAEKVIQASVAASVSAIKDIPNESAKSKNLPNPISHQQLQKC
ncbi:hypothetical protein ACFL0U_02515 [Pseudomonadota bacterium]